MSEPELPSPYNPNAFPLRLPLEAVVTDIIDDVGAHIASCEWSKESLRQDCKIAREIVRRVNAHDALVAYARCVLTEQRVAGHLLVNAAIRALEYIDSSITKETP